MLNTLERKIKKEYKQAYKEIAEKVKKYLKDFDAEDKKKLADLRKGVISHDEYMRWRTNRMLNNQQWADMRDVLAKDLSNANQIATQLINNQTVDIYAFNANYGAYEVCSGANLDLSFSLYDHSTVERLLSTNPEIIPLARMDIPKDMLWNRRKLTSAMTQGILQGDSIPNIAKRLMSVTDMNRKAAVRNARTYTTAAENGGRVDSYRRAESMGIQLQQEWMATMDMRTRTSHRHLDGERIQVGGIFSNGCRYPGDPLGRPEEIYNCRCKLRAKIAGQEYDRTGRFKRLPEGMTYEEWLNAKPEYKRRGKRK